MSFTTDLAKFCHQEAPAILDATVRKIVFEIHNRLDYRSPVGDADYWQSPAPLGYVGGAFRLNWQYGYGTPPSSVLDGVDPSGATARAAVESGVMSSPAAGVHYLVNNSPYAQRLEDGWSRQAPQGMITLVELELPQIVRMAVAS